MQCNAFLSNQQNFPFSIAGPQREIFPGGTKVDTGPSNLFEHQTAQNFLFRVFAQNKVKTKKKKVFTELSSNFLPKIR